MIVWDHNLKVLVKESKVTDTEKNLQGFFNSDSVSRRRGLSRYQ